MLKKYPLVFLILFLAIGYAGISSVHKIEGNIDIGYDENFGIDITNTTSYNGTNSINKDRKTITLKTDSLKSSNESILSFNIANKSRQYNASVTVNCSLKSNSASLSNYLEITSDNKNPVLLDSGTEKRIILTAKVNKNYTGSTGITPEVICTLDEKPISRSTLGKQYKSQYKESILNGADPVLDGKFLVPVTLANNGTVTYADTTEEWYNYANKKWANAVILVDNPSKSYTTNDIINESDIESYFVWIPRFKYTIFNEGNYTSYISGNPPTTSNAKEIQIQFEKTI